MKTKSVVSMLILLTVTVPVASAQVILTGTNYVQTFDSLASGLPPGWSVRTNATATALGTVALFTTNTTTWGNTSGQFANYASTVNNGTNLFGGESTAVQTACTNRGPGVRQTLTFGDPGAAFVLQIQDTLGLANFELIVDLNMLSAQNRSNFWTIDYGFGNSPISFTPVWTNSDPSIFGAMTRTISFGNALDNQALPIWIRIVALDLSTGSGSRDTFGIDNFRLNYQASGSVAPIPLGIQLIGTNTVLTWSNAAFNLQAAPLISGGYTNVPGATSPHTNPIVGPQQYFRLKAG
jgi:hypothetical protein